MTNTHAFERRKRRPSRVQSEPQGRPAPSSRLSEEASLRGRVQALKRLELAKRRTVDELNDQVDALHDTVDELLEEIESYSVEAEEARQRVEERGGDLRRGARWRGTRRSRERRHPQDQTTDDANAVQAAHDLVATTAQVAAAKAELFHLQTETATTRRALEQLRVEKNTRAWECAVQKAELEQLQAQIQAARESLASLGGPPPPPPVQTLENLLGGLSIGQRYTGTVERQVNEGLANRLAGL